MLIGAILIQHGYPLAIPEMVIKKCYSNVANHNHFSNNHGYEDCYINVWQIILLI
jgi:hypothetical protein